MNPVRRALYQALTAHTPLLELLEGRQAVYHERAPQDVTAPLIIFHKQAGTDSHVFDSWTGYHEDVWTVKAVDRSDSAGRAEDLSSAIDDALRLRLVLELEEEELHATVSRESDVEYSEDDAGETFRHVGALYRITTGGT